MQYGLSEKYDGIVRMVPAVAAVVQDVLEKSIAISKLDGSWWLWSHQLLSRICTSGEFRI